MAPVKITLKIAKLVKKYYGFHFYCACNMMAKF